MSSLKSELSKLLIRMIRLTPGKVRLPHEILEVLPGLHLLLRRHGILKIKDYRVAVEARNLVQSTLVDGWHRQHRPAQTVRMTITKDCPRNTHARLLASFVRPRKMTIR